VQTFSKKERLSSVKDIETLFKKGKSLFVFPLKVVFIPKKLDDKKEENEQKVIPPARLLISVSKRNFKKAVDRNRIKRQIREGYRLQKSEFDLSHIDTFAFISIAKEHIDSKFLHKRIKKLLQMLEKEGKK
jgi:ribonuclease P protein component